jgi:GTPase
MLYRLYQGSGYVIYYLGVADNGEIVGLLENDLKKSFELLQKVSEKIGAKLINFNKMKAKDKDKFYMKIVFKKTLNNTFDF